MQTSQRALGTLRNRSAISGKMCMSPSEPFGYFREMCISPWCINCVSVATCTCIGLLARLESYLGLIRIIRPLSISLTIYHYVWCTVSWWVARMGQTRTTHSRDNFIGFHQSIFLDRVSVSVLYTETDATQCKFLVCPNKSSNHYKKPSPVHISGLNIVKHT